MPRGRSCSICANPKLTAITTMLLNGSPAREVARAFGVSPSATHRHKTACMGAPTSRQIIKQRAAGAMALATLPTVDEANSAYASIATRLEGIIARCEADGSTATAIMGLRELKGVVAAQAQLAGLIGAGAAPTVNVAVKNEVNVDMSGMVRDLVAAITSLPNRDAAIDRLADLAGLSDGAAE